MNPTQPPERRRRDESSRERAVSDVVAFVLTFSIIIAGVGIVSTGGLNQLSQFTNDQQVNNAERGMEATASTVDNIHRNGDTYREFDLALNGGNIWFNETEMALESDDIDLSPLGENNEATIQTNALEHRFDLSDDEVDLAYEGGAVFRSDTARPRYEPSFRLADDKAIISLVNLTTDTSIDRSGAFSSDFVLRPTGVPSEAPVTADSQFISFRAELVDQERVYETDDDGIGLDIDVSETAYPDQWSFYFENVDEDGWDSDAMTYELENVDSVLIRVTTIELSLLPRGTL